MQGHPSIGEVIRVSEIDVEAGYDIESFNDNDSVFTDRFIEVKSFSGQVAFFWSRSEISAARQLEDKYHLYLVDRDQIGVGGYAPRILRDPYRLVYLNESWERDCVEWRFAAPSAVPPET